MIMNKSDEQLIALISSVISKKHSDKTILSDDGVLRLEQLAKRYDLSHFIGVGISKNLIEVPKEKREYYLNLMFLTAARMKRIDYEYAAACKALESAKIPFLPLKGSVIKKYYPESWMRTSCDIDILVHEEDIENAIAALNGSGKFDVSERNYHDVSLMSRNGIHIELHFSIQEDMPGIDRLLSRVWDYAAPIFEGESRCAATPEFFMFHIYAHASYHFLKGGCGVRQLIDVFLLENNLEYDNSELEKMLCETGILRFRDELKLLSEVWFDGKTHNDVTKLMEDFIFSGGMYGGGKNSIAVKGAGMSPVKYCLNRIWVPYNSLKKVYPILEKHKALMPACQFVRWGKFLFSNRHTARINEIKAFNSFDDNKKENTVYMLKELGLDEV